MYSKNRYPSGVILAGIMMALALGFCTWTCPAYGVDSSETDAGGAEIVPVQDVLASPENFTGTISVSGLVMNIDQAKSMFFLSCKTAMSTGSCACAKMPVKYGGQMPEVGSNVIVTGEVTTTTAGKYIFEGKEVKPE